MTKQEVYNSLCYYDTRNPNGIVSGLNPEEIEEEGWTDKAKEDCYCDNCFRGKRRFAEHILKLEKKFGDLVYSV